MKPATSGMHVYLRLVMACLRSQMQYRASFLMMACGQFLVTGLEFAAIAALFYRFGSIHGWQLDQVAFLYGVVGSGYALAEGLCRGFDQFSAIIRRGDFDRLLLRPRSTVMQVAAFEVQLMRIGRFLQAAFVLAWALMHLHTEPGTLMVAAAMVIGTMCTFCGLFVLQATLTFFTVETPEIVNVVTYGGVETASFPLSIYPGWLRFTFTWLVPLASTAYLPARMTFRAGHATLPALFAPVFGLLFLMTSLLIWRMGERHYSSTGT
jgi:ABC-2 type transport system permease protein